MLCLTLRIRTIKCFCIAHLADLCLTATDRTDFRNITHATSRQILCDLWNDHIRFVNFNLIANPQFQLFHNTDIVHTGTADCCALQFYRFKDCHRIDKSCSRRTPLNLQKLRAHLLICPFKCIGIAWELRCSSQRSSVCNIVINKYQSIRWEIIVHDFPGKFCHSIFYLISCHHDVFHNFKALFSQPIHLFLSGIMEIHTICLY